MAVTAARRAKKHEIDLGRLHAAVQRCRLTDRRGRAERVEMVRQFVGNHYSDEGTQEKVPLNLIAQYVQIVGRSLVPKEPRGLFATFDKAHKPIVAAEQDWCNKQIVKIRLAKTLRRVVTDALFGIGILKVAIATPSDSAAMSWNLQAGQPYAARVDRDDFVWDVHARDFDEVSFIGHRYRVPLDSVRDSSLYSKARKDLTPSQDEPFNQEGDQRINVIGRSFYTTNAEEFEDHVDLWEIYLPRKRLVLTLADPILSGEDGFDEPLRTQEWVGPDCGPYHLLGFGIVPGNAMFKGPIQDLMDLHLLVNELYRKLMRQAQRQKTNTFVRGGATEDGKRVQEANDGDIVRVDDPPNIQTHVGDGPNQANFLFMQNAYEMFSNQAGNLKLIGGIAPESKTATQDKMLMGSASAQIASMQQDTLLFVEDVFRSLTWYFHHHPQQTMRLRHQLPGLPEYEIERRVTPQQRQQVAWSEMDVDIDVYSMQPQTPESKVSAIDGFVKMIQPFMQMAQQQGIMLDLNALVDKHAKLLDMPELTEILTIQEPPQADGQGGQGGQGSPGMSAETTRNYVRRSQSGSQQEQQMDMMNQMAKGMGQNGTMPLNQNSGAA